ncbi:HU family DNA-binding protein [Bacillus sp. Bva_UNVM-123]|uniref:HU family DNA-binding protein n=1 Tax=Bacillus sp. Bva_UNVM-123 TaxID=2829798 RepID=UPI00391EFA8A
MTAYKTDLVSKVKEELSLDRKSAIQVVDIVLEAIQTLTKEHGKLQLKDHGNFEVRERAARKGRNPQTGEEIQIAASKVPAFKPSKAFRKLVNQ